jgi:hypothetical protein
MNTSNKTRFLARSRMYQRHIWIISLNNTFNFSESAFIASEFVPSSCIVVAMSDEKYAIHQRYGKQFSENSRNIDFPDCWNVFTFCS